MARWSHVGYRLQVTQRNANVRRASRQVLRVFNPSDTAGDAVSEERAIRGPAGLEPTPALMDELSEASERLESATPQEILGWVVARFSPRFTMATAFGPEGMVLIHMLAELAPETPIFNLDTGYQFAETLELRERVLRRYGIEVEMRRPELTVARVRNVARRAALSDQSGPMLFRPQDSRAARGDSGDARLGQRDSA